MTPQKRHCLDALLSTLAGAQWQSKGAALATPELSSPTSLSRRSSRRAIVSCGGHRCHLPTPREEKMLGKKKFESRAGQGERRMPGMVVKEKATAKWRKAPAHPRVSLDSHESCVWPCAPEAPRQVAGRKDWPSACGWSQPAGAGSSGTQAMHDAAASSMQEAGQNSKDEGD
jgi:hypothetical protein